VTRVSERVGVEIGGTFTDLVWRRADGRLGTHKVLSTPDALQQGVLRGAGRGGRSLPAVGHLVHGSTVATNALLTRSGAPTGLLVTDGFRDLLEIGRQDRTGNIYELLYRKPAPPVPRRHVREVRERILADGRVHLPLDLDGAWAQARELLAAGVTSFAISFLHAYRNPDHERAVAAMIRRRAPDAYVSASHEISSEFREYERTMTTAINAFVGPSSPGTWRRSSPGSRAPSPACCRSCSRTGSSGAGGRGPRRCGRSCRPAAGVRAP
jgi:N-methylhydantoinase A